MDKRVNTQAETDAIRLTLRVIELFRSLGPQVNLAWVAAFLHVAREPKVLQDAIPERANLTRSSAGRILQGLGDGSIASEIEGLDLIRSRPHGPDYRFRTLDLTDEGLRILSLLVNITRR